MNILSYNVRGLGRGIKWASIRRLRKLEGPDLICLQETKKEFTDKAMCQAIWGDSEVSWEMQPTINSAGGILCLWCENSFRLQRKVIGNGFIFLEGDLIREAQQINIIAIYSPCDIHGKRSLWEAVKHLKEAAAGGLWCILGDLNAIRDLEERFGSSQRSISDSSIIEFNNRIHELELLEVPWLGRKFTWIIPNGASRSRLDRCLVSPEWLNRWPASVQMTLARNFSDHCPILLRSKVLIGALNLL